MKRLWVLAFVLISLATSGSTLGATVVTHLGYVSSGQAYNDWIMKQAETFNKSQSDIRVEFISGNQEKMKTMMAAGAAPDVLDMPDFTYLGKEGGLVDVRPLLVRDNLWGSFNPVSLSRTTERNGALYMMPLYTSAGAAFFNRDMFDASGLVTPDRMGTSWTWEAMIAAGKKLTFDKDGNGLPEQFGIDRPWGYWRTAVFQAGGNFYEYDDNDQPVRSLWNSPDVLRGVEFVFSFYRDNITPHKYALNKALTEADYYFWKGKTAIDVNDGLAIIDAYLNKSDVNWDFALQPAGPAGPVSHLPGGGFSGPSILSSSKNVVAAWEWLKFLTTNKDRMEDFAAAVGLIPALTRAQPIYPKVKNLTQKNFRVVLEQANYPQPTQYPVDNSLNPRLITLNPIWSGQQSAATYLESVHQKVTAIITELRAKNTKANK